MKQVVFNLFDILQLDNELIFILNNHIRKEHIFLALRNIQSIAEPKNANM